MDITEGFLLLHGGISRTAVSLCLRRRNLPVEPSGSESSERPSLPAVAGAFIFLLSSLRMCSVTGRFSYQTGTGFGADISGFSIVLVTRAIALDGSTIRIKTTLLAGDDA
jgi:cobalt/nickel transport system permease protein